MINKEQLKIQPENITCIGDCLHNEYIDTLLNGVEDSELVSALLEGISKQYSKWICNTYTKVELKKLNVILRTKRETTLKKRCNDYILYLNRSHFTRLLNSGKTELFISIFKQYI